MINQNGFSLLLVTAACLLSACATSKDAAMKGAATGPTASAVGTARTDELTTGYGHGSDVPGQLDDGGWVMNTPGKAHSHKVLLAACPERPILTTHTHDHLHSAQTVEDLGSVAHKHQGCFVCPAKNSLVKRITGH